MKMKICVLTDTEFVYGPVQHSWEIPTDPRPHLNGHQTDIVVLTWPNSVEQVQQLLQQGYDLFINLCDAASDEEEPGIEVVQALENAGAAFTGASSDFYDPTRQQMKAACRLAGIPTPAWAHVSELSGLENTCQGMHYPMIVKHPNSYASIGLTPQSKVTNPDQLRQQAEIMINAYGATLVEEFIEGREFSVLVAENPDNPERPVAFIPVEEKFPAGETFKHSDIKWVNYKGMSVAPVSDPQEDRQLREMSIAFFRAFNGVGYGRCDIRMDTAGVAYMLEINPNCGLFYPPSDPGMADFILLNDPLGYPGFMDLIIRSAFKRAKKKNT
jgi:D-alanine-D-alanine ligase